MKQLRWGITVVLLILISSANAQTTPANAQVADLERYLLVRATPWKSADTVGRVASGATISVIGRSADNLWLQVQLDANNSGWVVGELVRVRSDFLALPITSSRNSIGITVELSPAVTDNIRRIYQRGQDIGRDPQVFSKIGDSITFAPHAYTALGTGEYTLAGFSYLRDTLYHYTLGRAHDGNPFINASQAAAIGWSAPIALNPEFADAQVCNEGEAPLLCEYRLSNPSIALIMYGTNDVGIINAGAYYSHMERIIQISIEQGVIPVISTIPPRIDFEQRSEQFNEVVVTLAESYQIPLWEYGTAMMMLPENGLDIDGVHPSIPPLGLRGTADFRMDNLGYGYVLRNLTALQILDAVRRAVSDLD